MFANRAATLSSRCNQVILAKSERERESEREKRPITAPYSLKCDLTLLWKQVPCIIFRIHRLNIYILNDITTHDSQCHNGKWVGPFVVVVVVFSPSYLVCHKKTINLFVLSSSLFFGTLHFHGKIKHYKN